MAVRNFDILHPWSFTAKGEPKWVPIIRWVESGISKTFRPRNVLAPPPPLVFNVE